MNIAHEINGIKYMLFNCPLPILTSSKNIDELYNNVNGLNGIIQGCDRIKGGFFSDDYFKITVLIPENKALEFSKHME